MLAAARTVFLARKLEEAKKGKAGSADQEDEGCNIVVPAGTRSNGVCLLRNSQSPSGTDVLLNLG